MPSPDPLTFRELLSPVTPDEFVRDYWDQRYLHVPGPRDKYRGLFDHEALAEAAVAASAGQVQVKSWHQQAGGVVETQVAAEVIPQVVAEGSTACLWGLDRADAKLAHLCRSLVETLGLAGDVNCSCYISPNGRGLDEHFDPRSVFTLQIEGSKRWALSIRPVVPAPLKTVFRYQPAPSAPWVRDLDRQEVPSAEVVLQPGDLLFLPAGTWHGTRAVGHSVAIAVGFMPLNPHHMFAEVLASHFLGHAPWRAGLPVRVDTGPAPKVAEAVRSALRERLAEFQQFVACLDVETLYDRWSHAHDAGRGQPRGGAL
jgi:ribosomal protein L16 Arg81 hydroxylase